MIDRKLVDYILKRRNFYLRDIFSKSRGFISLALVRTDLSGFLLQLDNLFFTIDFLEKEKLIEITKHGENIIPTVFDGYPESLNEEDISILHFYGEKLGNGEKAMSWEIKMLPGLFGFKKNGYLTNEQNDKRLNAWLAVGVALIASFLTAYFQTKLK